MENPKFNVFFFSLYLLHVLRLLLVCVLFLVVVVALLIVRRCCGDGGGDIFLATSLRALLDRTANECPAVYDNV